MKTYLITGHDDGTSAPSNAEEWGAFYQTISASIVDGGKPFSAKARVNGGKVVTDVDDDTTVGYYMIKAESLEDALNIVKNSPFADRPGCSVSVYETMAM